MNIDTYNYHHIADLLDDETFYKIGYFGTEAVMNYYDSKAANGSVKFEHALFEGWTYFNNVLDAVKKLIPNKLTDTSVAPEDNSLFSILDCNGYIVIQDSMGDILVKKK